MQESVMKSTDFCTIFTVSHAAFSPERSKSCGICCSFWKNGPQQKCWGEGFPLLVNEIVRLSNLGSPKLADAALHARYVLIDQQQLQEQRGRQRKFVESLVSESCSGNSGSFDECTQSFMDLPPSAMTDMMRIIKSTRTGSSELLSELAARYFNRDRKIHSLETSSDGKDLFRARIDFTEDEENEKDRKGGLLFAAFSSEALERIPGIVRNFPDCESVEVTILISGQGSPGDYIDSLAPFPCKFCALGVYPEQDEPQFTTYQYGDTGKWSINDGAFTFSPLEYRELRVERLKNFHLKLILRSENVTVLEGRAKENEKDMRLFALASTSETDPELSSRQDLTRMLRFERVFNEAVSGIRAAQQNYRFRLQWNRIIIYNRSLLGLRLMQLRDFGYNLVPRTIGLGLEKMVVYSRRKRWREETIREHELIFHNLTADQFTLRSRRPSSVPLTTLDSYALKVVRARQRNEIYPYELIKMITHAGFPLHEGLPRGEFEEFDIEVAEDGSGRAVSVKGREPGNNGSNIIFGRISNTDPVSGTVFSSHADSLGSHRRSWQPGGRGVPQDYMRHRYGRRGFNSRGMGSGILRSQNHHGFGYRKPGLDRCNPEKDNRIHPGRGRNKYNRPVYKCGRPVLLECRSHHADAYPGTSDHDR